jgi:hypothetical protein
VQVFAGVRKLSDAAVGAVVEASASLNANNGAFLLAAPITTSGPNFNFASKGTTQVGQTAIGFTSPVSAVLTGIGDISAPLATFRANGVQVATSSSTQGTGNYLAYPIYIGRRGGSSLPFNGRLYSLIVRFGPNLTTGQITATESWVNGKIGAY